MTGASRGIGAAVALELRKRGYIVGCLSRSGAPPAEAPERENFVCLPCDVTDEASVRSAVAALAERAGRIDGLVNNAGVHRRAKTHELTLVEFDEVMRTNATSTMLLSREVYPHLRAAGRGRIVNMGSFFERLGVPHNLAYCASKAAISAMGRCLAVEWAPDNIQVVTVAPGYVRTDLNADFLAAERFADWIRTRVPAGRPGEAGEIARLVGALFSEDIPFLTGETIYVDGGQTIAH